MAQDKLIDGMTPEEFLKDVRSKLTRGRPPKEVSEKIRRAEEMLEAQRAQAIQERSDPKVIVEAVKRQFMFLRIAGEDMINGKFYGVAVSGAPGIGKTHTLDQEVFGPAAKAGKIKYRKVAGAVTPVQLVKVLHQSKTRDDVLLLDDSDSVFEDKDAANILKAALDSYPVRKISWLSSTPELEEDQKEFLFEGKVAFITNRDLRAEVEAGTKTAKESIEPFLDRVKYMDLKLHSKAQRAAWVVYVLRETQMLTKRPNGQQNLTKRQAESVAKYIEAHWPEMRGVSLRTAGHMADFVHMAERVGDLDDATSWRDIVSAFSL